MADRGVDERDAGVGRKKNTAYVSREATGSQKHGKAVFGGKLVLPVHREYAAVKSFNRFQVTKRLNGHFNVWIWDLQLQALSGTLYSITVKVPADDFCIGGRTVAAMKLWKARRDLRERVRRVDAKNNAGILEVELAVRWPDSPFRFTGQIDEEGLGVR